MIETAKEFIQRKNKEFDKEKKLKFKHIERKGKHIHWREAWVFMPQTNHPEKVFLFERLRAGKFEGWDTFNFWKGEGANETNENKSNAL